MESKFIKDYLGFHKKFGFDLPKTFVVPGEGLSEVRTNFLFEELTETATALGQSLVTIRDEETNELVGIEFKEVEGIAVDPVEVLDGLVDIIYVAIGTAAFCGFLDDSNGKTVLEKAWDEVHRSNMEKVKVSSASESKRNTIIDMLKPENWTPPQLAGLVP